MWSRELPTLARRNGVSAFDELFDRVFRGARPPLAATGIDLFATEEGYGVVLDLPGLDPAKLNVRLEEGQLVVAGERETSAMKGVRWIAQGRAEGAIERRIDLPEDVDGDAIKAEFRHGTLSLTLPRRPEARPKPISVRVRE